MFFLFLRGVELKTFFFHPQHFLGRSLCNLLLQIFSFLFIQTLYNDCSHIEDGYLILHLKNIFSFLWGVELRHFYPKCLGGVWFV